MNLPPTGRERGGGAEIALQFDEVIVIRAEDSRREERLRWRERERPSSLFFSRGAGGEESP